ncbi:alanine racemase [Pelagovum pacificum]|uniref:Alanine racemase n=1 Tax=Pelagovum pacificum TaxID=2588711 RepID=A0A5C5GF40_9RHOB|nr:alanine racemase [Pelagovum pacificum]QQA44097.1 alanine racemase [Pelagovum pacificum]TNY32774.1 alanine racemase [Pelagovum pacificum]
MGTGHLTIDLDALVANYKALAGMGSAEAAAVVKADGYGTGVSKTGRALMNAGARRFFVAVAEEGAALRQALGPNADICVFGGHMAGDTDMISDLGLVPMLNSLDQVLRHFEALPGHPFGIQLDTGMNRLGMEFSDWAAVADIALAQKPVLLMSHLACADEPDHPMNAHQLEEFRRMTDGTGVPRSLAATGGILLGPDYHFDMTRPGIGLYGGQPFNEARTVVQLDLPVIQTRSLEPGETVGYGNTWTAERPTTIATVSGGYADGITRHLSHKGALWHGDIPCPIRGRVSMDLIGVDITDLPEEPKALSLLNEHQGVDDIAGQTGTIGYEILTQLGLRYSRRYAGA